MTEKLSKKYYYELKKSDKKNKKFVEIVCYFFRILLLSMLIISCFLLCSVVNPVLLSIFFALFLFSICLVFYTSTGENKPLVNIGINSFLILLLCGIITFVFILFKHYLYKDYYLKLDYVNNTITNLENDNVINNISFFYPSFKNSISHEDILEIEKGFHQDKKYFNLNLYDEQNNHFIMTNDFFKDKFYLKEIYFDKKDFSIKTVYCGKARRRGSHSFHKGIYTEIIYCDKTKREVFTLEKDIEVGHFNERLNQYQQIGTNKVKILEDL